MSSTLTIAILEDQYSFYPFGNMTSALVFLMHKVTQYLKTNSNVLILN